MAGSSSYVPSQLPGLTLKAWALVTGTGTLVKGYNVSGSVRNSVGAYTLTFSGGAVASYSTAFCRVSVCHTAGSYQPFVGSAYLYNSTTGAVATYASGSAAFDFGLMFIEVYE